MAGTREVARDKGKGWIQILFGDRSIGLLMKVMLSGKKGASSLSKWVTFKIFTEMERNERRYMGEGQEFSFKQSKYEMPVKDSCGDVQV